MQIETSSLIPDPDHALLCGAVERLLGRLPLIMWATDSDLRLTWTRGGAIRMLGMDQLCAIGAALSEIFGSSEHPLVEKHRQAMSGQNQSVEMDWQDRSYEIWIEALQDESGSIVGSVAVAHDITEEKRAERAMLWQSSFDPMTGALNRTRFCEHLESLLVRTPRLRSDLAIVYVDVDGFSSINDSFGIPAADAVLRKVAERLIATCPVDASVARVGADEFAITFPLSAEDRIEALCSELQARFARPFSVSGRALHVSISVGTARYPRDGESVEQLLRSAAAAARHAHYLGGSQSAVFSPALVVGVRERRQIDDDLHRALERNELFLMYQPQIHLDDGTLSGVEALLRWRRDGNVVPAGSFIRYAEESSIMIPIGEWVLEHAIEQLSIWKNRGLDPCRVAVNIGARQLADESILASIRNTLRKHGVTGDSLDIEITETAAMQNMETTMQLIEELRAIGAQISIDDFGTGYSSLSYLQRFAITGLKIDRSFIAELPQSPTAAAIVNAIISTARALGIRAIAEGVENEQQAVHLRASGCLEAQGFLYARPLSADAMTHYLETSRQHHRNRRTTRSRKGA